MEVFKRMMFDHFGRIDLNTRVLQHGQIVRITSGNAKELLVNMKETVDEPAGL